MALGFAIVSAVLGTASVVEGRKARKSQERANRAQERGRQLTARKQAIEAAREAQIQRARAIAQGTNQGAGDSSILAGVESSIESTGIGNIHFLDQIDTLSQTAFRHIQKANRQAGNAQGLSQLASVSSSASNMFQPEPETKT